MIRYLVFFLFCGTFCYGQILDNDYAAIFNFDDLIPNQTNVQNTSGTAAEAILVGDVKPFSGVHNSSALRIDPGGYAQILSLDRIFGNGDFGVSFYFMATDLFTTDQEILSKRLSNCADDGVFSIQVSPALNRVKVIFAQNSTLKVELIAPLSTTECWQHITVVRQASVMFLYVNGLLVDERVSPAGNRINVRSDGELVRLGTGICTGKTTNAFTGLVDELFFFQSAINKDEVATLYKDPDRIDAGVSLNNVVNLYLGDEYQTKIDATFPTISYEWTPREGVSAVTAKEPILTPTETTSYQVNFKYSNLGCLRATDSIRVVLIDPSEIDCGQALLPKAFSPNNDNLNDLFGVTNSFVIQELIAFEVFDRWGNLIFLSQSADDLWDGTYQNEKMMPGIYVYKVRYRCNNEEQSSFGNFSLIR